MANHVCLPIKNEFPGKDCYPCAFCAKVYRPEKMCHREIYEEILTLIFDENMPCLDAMSVGIYIREKIKEVK